MQSTTGEINLALSIIIGDIGTQINHTELLLLLFFLILLAI